MYSRFTVDINLVEYCLRALGEHQATDLHHPKLLNVEHDVSVLQPSGHFPVSFENRFIPSPLELTLDQKSLPEYFVNSVKASRISAAEIMYCDPHPPKITAKKIIRSSQNNPPNFQDIVNIRKFCEEMTTEEAILMLNIMSKTVEHMSPEEKAEYYWVLRLLNRSSSIVLGILRSVEGLEKEGFKNWILPTGDKIPLSDLKMAMIEVSPSKLWLVKYEGYIQYGGDGSMILPHFAHARTMEKNILISSVDPEMGFMKQHYVLEAKLPNGTDYIIDPTARQFGLKGNNGTLIFHSTWEGYKAEFPGFVDRKLSSTPKLYSFAYMLGNGPFPRIERIQENLIKYLNRRICNYCGQIEGLHPESVTPNLRNIFESVNLSYCSACKLTYCGLLCQKLDWKNHKSTCMKTLKEEHLSLIQLH